ncbi:MAG: hypothetical protein AMJ90_06400 [candidate division Zixibacteria bacterium SM23_73_2]|nr:MAG: hypothetical protein AMJ90_06400 [candidate division Zixibacteria bacterium SM23_73_2]
MNHKDFLKKVVLLLVLFVFLFPNFARSDSYSSLNNKGNKHYNQGLYDQALKYYQKAEIENPASPEVSYNLGSAFYQKQNYQEALSSYNKALNLEDSLDLANTYYNLGNTFYRSGKYQEAIGAYQRCLEINPEDEDAKFNLELVKKKTEKMLQNEKERQEEENKEKKEKREDQKKQEEQKGQQKQQEKQKQSQPEEKKGEQEKREREKIQPPTPKEGMTKEDAERILNSIKDDEKELQKHRKAFLSKKRVKVGKDW